MIKELKNKEDIIALLSCSPEQDEELYQTAVDIRNKTIGNKVYLRGLIEISNTCLKNCLYCGIRKDNIDVNRYSLKEEEIYEAALFAYKRNFGSIVLQGGERNDKKYTLFIENVIREIKRITDNKLGITLSLGDQTEETYKRWLDAGAHRYLLRIESSNPELYAKIHPAGSMHSYTNRIKSLELLKKCGYQTGSGVMIGLPFQTVEDLADDLLFLKSMDIDMVGMGPYLEHENTPLYHYREQLKPLSERLRLGLHMIAVLRILMPDVNIASTTALQTIDPFGREKGLAAGANVIMPNISPAQNRKKYTLYQNKPFSEESDEITINKLSESIRSCGCEIAFGEWGDPVHFAKRNKG
ncbi:[FeFe] hydrogenase H-cluster radical SAM maturase HydE [Odoribacter sp. OttesenSCG-928-J03]|nr:[FeFe] hydrogenase H-cluster radical SAM maturase HydE [Odoribacter sp. OttesenSCG-928-J03]MDL2283142.1 [FeFe] hydrogenase H-cluster radical SAM maturase HydE [Odoribacter sp. OttesenSCG-928-G04]MDL2330498.1 [FeFe] hydrogenase H-cluster radical SAM maturase HydE [Odoribacter sp. OttesenSCG-928-A06]